MYSLTDKEIVLEDERALLQPLQWAHYEKLLPFALQEPELWKYSLLNPAGEAGMKRYVEQAVNAREKGTDYPFLVIDKKDSSVAGSTRFYDIQIAHDAVQLGYTWYGSAYQRTGLNRHCKYLLLQFAFETWGALRVEFRADANNERSIAAMKAIGCVPEGILRNHLFTESGVRRSSIVLSILKEEWENGVKEKLGKMTGR